MQLQELKSSVPVSSRTLQARTVFVSVVEGEMYPQVKQQDSIRFTLKKSCRNPRRVIKKQNLRSSRTSDVVSQLVEKGCRAEDEHCRP